MTELARRDPESSGLDDMPLLVAEARASVNQPLEAEILRRYGFAVPTDAALDAIVACSPRGVLELGAGAGQWAALLARRGVDVVAYDVAPPRRPPTHGSPVCSPGTMYTPATSASSRNGRTIAAPRLADAQRHVGV